MGSHEFRLSPTGKGQGVSCDENGAFLGAVPLLKRVDGEDRWQVINSAQLSEEIGALFGLPIDMSSKMSGLKVVADALNAGDIARAQIATVLLGIPDPPLLSKTAHARGEMIRFIHDLHWSGMIKADWDPDEHPRWPAGAPDSQGGQFAPKGEGGEASDATAARLDTNIVYQTRANDTPEHRAQGILDDGVYRPDSDPAELDPTASSPEQLKQNWQQHQDEVDRQVRLLESKSYGSLKVTRNVSFIGKNAFASLSTTSSRDGFRMAWAGFGLHPSTVLT